MFTMQPIRLLRETLEAFGSEGHYLFLTGDFYPLFPAMRADALRVLLGRAVRTRLLTRMCGGVYLYPRAVYTRGYELYHAAARLREESFCYVSLESALSEAGLISQMPIGCITLMTGGRSGLIDCGRWGRIEFVHTKKRFESLSGRLVYDPRYRLWRAGIELALEDMRRTRRSMDLVDTEGQDEST